MGWPAGGVRLERDRFVAGQESASFEDVASAITRGTLVEVTGAYDGTHQPGEPGDFEFAGYVVDDVKTARREENCLFNSGIELANRESTDLPRTCD